MDALLNPNPVPYGHRRGAIQVRVIAWGNTDGDQRRALVHAQSVPARSAWEFVEIERRAGATSPLNLKDPKALAADQGYGWAYVVYRAGGAR